jgi:phosphomannomutase
LHKAFPNQPLKAAIAYDCRHNSDTLAKLVADVFSANGIGCILNYDLHQNSFAVKHLGCQCGMYLLTQPSEYNGYKVYWQDGGQIVPQKTKLL